MTQQCPVSFLQITYRVLFFYCCLRLSLVSFFSLSTRRCSSTVKKLICLSALDFYSNATRDEATEIFIYVISTKILFSYSKNFKNKWNFFFSLVNFQRYFSSNFFVLFRAFFRWEKGIFFLLTFKADLQVFSWNSCNFFVGFIVALVPVKLQCLHSRSKV